MKAIYSILVLFSTISVYAQDGISYLNKFSKDFNIQFAFDPEQISQLQTPLYWAKIDNKKDLEEALIAANLEIAEVETNRWLIRKKLTPTESSTYIKGHVSENGEEALVSALIYTKDGEYAALTDEVGAFILEIPAEKECEICCQYLGYEVKCVPNDDFLAFELQPKIIIIDDVQITTKKVQLQITKLDDSEVMKIKNSAINRSMLGSDVLRSVQLLSGVDATNDLSASMVVRASSGLQSLITLDGIPLYNTESAFGMFSVLNPLVVTKSALYKNTMPLEYGEFTGGYLACEGLINIQEKLKLDIDLNTLQTSGAIQIPFGKATQMSAAFRRSNGRISNSQYYSRLQSRRRANQQFTQFINRPDNLPTSLENEFGDLYFNLKHEGKKDRKLSFSLFGNRDISGASYSNDYFIDRGPVNDKILVKESYLQEKTKANIGMSFSYLKTYKKGAEFQILFYASAYGLIDTIASDVSFRNSNIEKVNRFDSKIENSVRDNNLKFQFETSPERNWRWKLGLDLRRISTDFIFSSNNITPFRQELVVPIITPYVGIGYHFEDIFVANFGVRNASIPVKNPVTFASPRANARLKLNDYLFLKTSASVNQQFFRPIELERQLGQSTSANIISTGKNIPVLKSNQATLGLQYDRVGIKINGDLYIRKNDGILEQVLSMPGLSVDNNDVFGNNSYDLFRGVNNVAGFDITSSLEHKGFFGLLSYTYTNSVDRFPKLFKNKPIVDQNNRLHQVNLFGSYNVNSWTFSSTYVFGSGVYTLDRAAVEKNINRINIDPAKLFTQLPSYNRWDISASYKWPTKVGDFHFDLGILNVTDYNNVNSELYIYNVQEENQTALGAAQVELLGRIWTVGVRYGLGR